MTNHEKVLQIVGDRWGQTGEEAVSYYASKEDTLLRSEQDKTKMLIKALEDIRDCRRGLSGEDFICKMKSIAMNAIYKAAGM